MATKAAARAKVVAKGKSKCVNHVTHLQNYVTTKYQIEPTFVLF